MKKLLTLVGSLSVITGTAASVVSCGTKATTSLDDESFALESNDGKKFYDIMRWDSEVVSNSNFKDKFMANYNPSTSDGTDPGIRSSYLEAIKGAKSATQANGDTSIGQILAEYEASSTTSENVGKWTAATLDAEFVYKIYDEDNKIISTFDKGQWDDTKDAINFAGKVENTGVTVLTFSIEIDATHSTIFTGVRKNIKEDNEDLSKYYTQIREDLVPTTKAHDYRFQIQFYI